MNSNSTSSEDMTVSKAVNRLSDKESEIKINKKIVGYAESLSLCAGSIIGSGIFIAVKPTFDVFTSDSIGMTLLFWIIGGILSMFGALVYVELGTRVPESGGERAYFKAAINVKISTLFVIIFTFFIKSIALAALSLTAGKYFLKMIFPESNNLQYIEKMIAAIILTFCFIVNSVSGKMATKFSIVYTFLKLSALGIIIGCGIYSLATGGVKDWNQPFLLQGFDMRKLGVCIVNVQYSVEGWNVPGLVAGDMKDPARILPVSVILGVIIVIVFYCLTIVSYTSVLGFGVARQSDTLALSVGVKILKQAYPIIALLVFFSCIGAANGRFFSLGRLCMSAGCRGELPKIFSLVHRKQETPIFTLFVIYFLSLLFLPFEFQSLLNYVSFMSWIFYFIASICIYILRYREKMTPKNIFKTPIILIIIFQILCCFMIGMSFYNAYSGCIVFAIIMSVVLGYQFIPEKYTKFGIVSKIHDRFSLYLQDIFNMREATEQDIL